MKGSGEFDWNRKSILGILGSSFWNWRLRYCQNLIFLMLYLLIWVLGADSVKINSFMASEGSIFQSFCQQKSPLRVWDLRLVPSIRGGEFVCLACFSTSPPLMVQERLISQPHPAQWKSSNVDPSSAWKPISVQSFCPVTTSASKSMNQFTIGVILSFAYMHTHIYIYTFDGHN